jgi:hypothetical protein
MFLCHPFFFFVQFHNYMCFFLLKGLQLGLPCLLIYLRIFSFFLQGLHIFCALESFCDTHGFLSLLQLLHCNADFLLFLVQMLDLFILLQSSPFLCSSVKTFCDFLGFPCHIFSLEGFFLLYFIVEFRRSHRIKFFFQLLYLLPISLNSLCNDIYLFVCAPIWCVHGVWNAIIYPY